MQAAVLLGVGMRLIPGVDDRPGPGRGAGDAFPDVLGPLGQAEGGRLGSLQHFAGAADQLTGDQEGQQHVGDPGEFPGPHDQIILVASVGVACRVGVVLEQVDIAADALVGKPLFGVDQEVFQDPLAGPVVGDELNQVVALCGGVLGVTPDVQIQAGPIAQEHVRTATPGHHPAEQIAGHLVRTQASVTVKRAGDTELGLDAHDSSLHAIEPTGWSRPSPRLPLAFRSWPKLSRTAQRGRSQPSYLSKQP